MRGFVEGVCHYISKPLCKPSKNISPITEKGKRGKLRKVINAEFWSSHMRSKDVAMAIETGGNIKRAVAVQKETKQEKIYQRKNNNQRSAFCNV